MTRLPHFRDFSSALLGVGFLALVCAGVGIAVPESARADPNPACTALLDPASNTFARRLHGKNPVFHTTTPVERELQRRRAHGQRPPQDPAAKIEAYLEVLEQVHTRGNADPRIRERLRESYHDQYVIPKERIPESYFSAQQRLARERGHGNVEITPEARETMSQDVIRDQATSLDRWFDHLLDSPQYPFYAKYWAFRSVVKLAKFDPGLGSFAKRSAGTAAPFPELNEEALAHVIDQFTNRMRGIAPAAEIDPRFVELLETEDFAKLYGHQLKLSIEAAQANASRRGTIEGKWVKYPRGSDPGPLVRSLEGKGTGWCTANEATARQQLNGGDFHVFYSLDERGNPTQPRVAIRQQGETIEEVRGVAAEQNLDSGVAASDVVSSKMKEFGSEGQRYADRDAQMQRLTAIEGRWSRGETFDRDELRFLYEVEGPIEGFGSGRDPRIDEILAGRDARKDLAKIFDLREEQISIGIEDFSAPGIQLHIGDIAVTHHEDARGLRLPRIVFGSLKLSGVRSAKGLELPEFVRGSLNLAYLESARGLKLPATIGWDLNLASLRDTAGLKFPERIRGSLILSSIVESPGLKLPRRIGGRLDLLRLQNASGISFPEEVGELGLWGLKSAKGLKLPGMIRGKLDLSQLTSAEGLELSGTIHGALGLKGLKSGRGLRLPRGFAGSVELHGLTSGRYLELPEDFAGSLFLNGLRSARYLRLPKTLGGILELNGLTSAQYLKLPDSVGRALHLDGLTSAEFLKLPAQVGDLYLDGLESARYLELPAITGSLHLSGLTSARYLKLPASIGGHLSLASLKSARYLQLPESIGRNLYLGSLKSAEFLKLPTSIGESLDLGGLTSARDLSMSSTIGKDLYIQSLRNADGLGIPKGFSGTIHIGHGLKKEDLKLPADFVGKVREPAVMPTRR